MTEYERSLTLANVEHALKIALKSRISVISLMVQTNPCKGFVDRRHNIVTMSYI